MTTQKEDLTDDDALGDVDTTQRDLSKQFLHAGYTFKGMPLRPYTAGTDLLFNQVLDRNDAPFTIFLTFVFIHIEERTKLIGLCWDKAKFREALLIWVDSLGALTNEDKQEAMTLFEDVRGWARKSSVEVDEKKTTKAKRRQRSRA
jgi:hypothetical protein